VSASKARDLATLCLIEQRTSLPAAFIHPARRRRMLLADCSFAD
jgi:hypothetical protein